MDYHCLLIDAAQNRNHVCKSILLEFLWSRGVDVNASKSGMTPLFVSCEKGDVSMASLLMRNGAEGSRCISGY